MAASTLPDVDPGWATTGIEVQSPTSPNDPAGSTGLAAKAAMPPYGARSIATSVENASCGEASADPGAGPVLISISLGIFSGKEHDRNDGISTRRGLVRFVEISLTTQQYLP